MNSFFAKMIITLAGVLLSGVAFAQTCPAGSAPAPIIMGKGYQGGAPCWGQQPSGSQWVPGGGEVAYMPIQGNPGLYTMGGNTYRCSTARRVVGGVIGAVLGFAAGKRIHDSGGNYGGGGAILGTYLGSEIACEMVSSPVGGQVVSGGQVVNNGQTTRLLSDCDVDGAPDLQNLKGLTEAQCKAIAARGIIKGTAGQSTDNASQEAYCSITATQNGNSVTKNVPNPEKNEAYCDNIKGKLRSGSIAWDNLPVITAKK